MDARMKHEDLNVDENSVLVLQNAGPLGVRACRNGECFRFPTSYCGAACGTWYEISDARMSGTSYGTCVLHVSPESYVGGPLALVKDGDAITLDIPNRKLDLLVPEAELESRRSQWIQPVPKEDRGYLALYRERVTQAHQGCDFDFLVRDAAAGGTGNPLAWIRIPRRR